MHKRTLKTRRNGDLPVSDLGFGGAPLGNLYRPLAETDAQATLDAAFDAGITLFDTAPFYGLGLSEERFGKAIARWGRDNVVLSTKIGRWLEDCPADEVPETIFFDIPSRKFTFDYSYDGVMRSYEQSLRRIATDRIDILLVHDADVWTHGSKEASDQRFREVMDGGYKALDSLRSSGAIQGFGCGLNEWDTCETFARAGDFDCFLLAGRYTLLEQEALDSFLPLCVERDIGIILGGPYNSGILATGPVDGAKYNYSEAPPEIMDKTRRIKAVCDSHGVALAEAALHFILAHPAMVSVIPGAVKPSEVEQNVAVLNATIPDGLWSDLKSEGLVRTDAPTPGS